MSNIAIRVENLSKLYKIGARRNRHDTLRDHVAAAVKSLFSRNGHSSSASPPVTLAGAHSAVPAHPSFKDASSNNFWALKDVSFEVKRGEVIGIIGRNGAGKSTLLKILSRITEPTSGFAEIHGRVGSLLEVGTGFHPELTGRENVYLNGAILGMKKAEIERKFDEIVAFSEIEKFIDTPVKRYSSGMYVRLAFAVAAHMDPEILIVDEVLAVGDAQFQKKCLGKISHVAKAGRTVLFVSHNTDAIRRLCSRAVWLDGGAVRSIGETDRSLSSYLLRGLRDGGIVVFDPPHRMASGMPVLLHSVKISDESGQVTTHFSTRSPLRITIEWENSAPLYKPRIGFLMQTTDGRDVLTALDASAWAVESLPPGRRISSCSIPGGILNEGEYVIDVGADSPKRFDFTRSRTGAVLRFELEDDMTLPNKYYGQEGFRDARWPGIILLNLPWTQEHIAQGPSQSDL
jgi:lipopolysaccharide transport system ATP-binding protein